MLKNIFLYYIASSIFVLAVFALFLPDKSVLSNISELIIVLPIVIYLFIPKLLKGKGRKWKEANFGFIYFMVMAGIMVIGNINNFIVKYVYPSFGEGISITNYYWMGGMIFFAFGFIQYTNRINAKNKNNIRIYRKLSFGLIIFIFFLSFIGTIYSYFSLGYIPFISGSGTGLRYTGSVADVSLPVRLWKLCVVSSLLSFIYYLKVKKNTLILIIFVLSTIFSLFFIIRMYPFLIFITILLFIYINTKNKKKLLIILIPLVILYFFLNQSFVLYRSGHSNNPVFQEKSLSSSQKIIYSTFNEYRQLNIALNDYEAEPQYGLTLISIPIAFIPAPLLSAVNIDKSKIQKNNSAVLMANFLKSRTSTGIRIGILGEFYINFKYLGFLFMYFIGLVVGFIQKSFNKISPNDYRYGFYLLIFVILLYALIGQANAIGSLLANYLLFMILLFYLFPKKVIKHKTI
jgi:hypothetical protein